MSSRIVSTTAEYTIRDQERMQLASRYFDWQRSMTVPELGSRVLEIGCGMGNFTQHLVDRELVIGIDVGSDCIEQHMARFRQHPHIHASVLDILDSSFVDTIGAYRPGSIVCLNVLEHISDDYKALQHMHDVLPKGGRAVFMVPAFEMLYGPIDANLGHYRRYSKGSMRKVAEATGFKVNTLRFVNSIGFLGWLVNAKVLKKQSNQKIRSGSSIPRSCRFFPQLKAA